MEEDTLTHEHIIDGPLYIKFSSEEVEKEKNTTNGELIVRYYNGEQDAFDHIYMRCRTKLYTYLLRKLIKTGNNTLAEDIFAITWTKVTRFLRQIAAMAKNGDFDGEVIRNGVTRKRSFCAYLKMIARNTLLDYLISPQRKEQSLDNLLNDDTRLDVDGDVHNNGQSFEQQYLTAPVHEQPEVRIERQDQLANALNQLSKKQRDTFLLKLEGRSLDEIAKDQGIKTGGVSSRIKAINKIIAEILKQDKNDDKKAITKENV